MSIRINTKGAQKKIMREVKKFEKKKNSQIASAINKEIRAARKEITEEMMKETGLKRKVVNDRLSISRASPKSLQGRITPIYGRKIWMMDYPISILRSAGRTSIKLLSSIYKKTMRTGFISKDGKRMFLRLDSTKQVEAVKGRTIPRLFDEMKMKKKHETNLIKRVLAAVGVALRR